MPTTKKSAKKKNPPDATLRNVRAAKARATGLRQALHDLERRVQQLEATVLLEDGAIRERLVALELAASGKQAFTTAPSEGRD